MKGHSSSKFSLDYFLFSKLHGKICCKNYVWWIFFIDPFILKFINPNIRQTRLKKNSKLDLQSEVDAFEPAVAIQTQNIKLKLKTITEMKNSTGKKLLLLLVWRNTFVPKSTPLE